MILPGALISYKYGYLLNHNTRIEVQAWIKDNIGAEDKLYSFDYIVEMPLSVEAARWQTEKNNINSAKNKFILDNQNKLDAYGYNLFYDFGNKRYQMLAGENISHVLISYTGLNSKKNILDELNKYHQFELVKTFFPADNIDVGDSVNNPNNFFTLLRLNKSGPYIEIYEIK